MLTWTAKEVAGLGRRPEPLRIYGAFAAGDWAPSADPIPWNVPVACDALPACMQRVLLATREHSITSVRRAMDHYARTREPREAVGVVRAYVPSWKIGGLSIPSVVLVPLPSLAEPAALHLMRAALGRQAAWHRGSVRLSSYREALRALRETGHQVRPVACAGSWWLRRAPGWLRRALRRLTSRWADHPAIAVLAAMAAEHGVDVYEQGVEVVAWAGTCAAGGWGFDELAGLAEVMGSGIVPLARVDGEVLCVRHPGALEVA